VTLVRTAVLISAPIDVVFDLSLAESLAEPASGPVTEMDRPRRYADTCQDGLRPAARHVHRFAATGAGTLMTDELQWTSRYGVLGRLADALLFRRQALRALLSRAARLTAAAEQTAAGQTAAAPGSSTVDSGPVVVGAALLDGTGRVLAAQRAGPPSLAGRWEFPGGKVEPGEPDTVALVRECREELGVEVELDGRLGGDFAVEGGAGVLRVWIGRIVAGVPVATEHAALRWLDASELDEVDWLAADRPLVELVRARLR
jgi:8-oxo-dGTP diphosphatase